MTEESQEQRGALTPWDSNLMAWHESGHVVVSHYSPGQERICRVSIDPTDKAFGMMKTEKREHHNMTRQYLLGVVAVALAGRLSEEKFLHEVSSSCIHDLNKARDIAVRMVSAFGMGARTGLVSCCNQVDHSLYLLSEQQRECLYLDVRDLITEARDNASRILDEHGELVSNIAACISKKKTLEAVDIDALLGVRKPNVWQKGI